MPGRKLTFSEKRADAPKAGAAKHVVFKTGAGVNVDFWAYGKPMLTRSRGHAPIIPKAKQIQDVPAGALSTHKTAMKKMVKKHDLWMKELNKYQSPDAEPARAERKTKPKVDTTFGGATKKDAWKYSVGSGGSQWAKELNKPMKPDGAGDRFDEFGALKKGRSRVHKRKAAGSELVEFHAERPPPPHDVSFKAKKSRKGKK